jgi:hypothetical protein
MPIVMSVNFRRFKMPKPEKENDTIEAVETSLDLIKKGDPKTTWAKLSKSAERIEKWSSVRGSERARPQPARCKR